MYVHRGEIHYDPAISLGDGSQTTAVSYRRIEGNLTAVVWHGQVTWLGTAPDKGMRTRQNPFSIYIRLRKATDMGVIVLLLIFASAVMVARVERGVGRSIWEIAPRGGTIYSVGRWVSVAALIGAIAVSDLALRS